MKNFLLMLSLVVLSTASLFAIAPPRPRGEFVVGLIGYKHFFTDLKLREMEKPYLFGLEVGLPEAYLTIAPKISLEWFPLSKSNYLPQTGIYLNITAAEFFSKAAAPDLRLIPQVGYSPKGLSVVYGYALPILRENTMVMRHRISVEISIPTWLFGDTGDGCE